MIHLNLCESLGLECFQIKSFHFIIFFKVIEHTSIKTNVMVKVVLFFHNDVQLTQSEKTAIMIS